MVTPRVLACLQLRHWRRKKDSQNIHQNRRQRLFSFFLIKGLKFQIVHAVNASKDQLHLQHQLTCFLFNRFFKHFYRRKEAKRGSYFWSLGKYRWTIISYRVKFNVSCHILRTIIRKPALQPSSLRNLLCCSLAREFCLESGHTFTHQLDKVGCYCCTFKLHSKGHLDYPNVKYVFYMLVSIVTDSVHFTRCWVQYCHPSLICKRKSHA